MPRRFYSVEDGKVVFAGSIDGVDAVIAGDWVNMGLWNHCSIIIIVDDMDSQSAAVTLDQAATNAGGDTELKFDIMYTNDADTTLDTYAKTAVSGETFNIDTNEAIYIIEINADMLDAATPFLQCDIATPGGNTPTYSMIYILSGPRYGGSIGLPSAL